MRLLVVFPLTGITETGMIERKQQIREVIGSDVHVDIKKIEEGPLSIESKSEEIMAAYQLFKLLEDVNGIEEKYDGLMIWCAGDPGVEALREQFSIPVIGPGQAMISVANMVSSRFGMVCPNIGDSEMIKNIFYHLGLEQRLVTKKVLDIPVLNLKVDPESLIQNISTIAEEMIEEHDIEALLLGCMGFFGVAKQIERNINIPVIDPGVIGLQVLKMMVSANITFSKRKYPPLIKGGIVL